MARPKQPPPPPPPDEEATPPTSYPSTPPPVGTDVSAWLLQSNADVQNALGRVEAAVGAMQTQLGRVESKIDSVVTKVEGHGRWMHTFKLVMGFAGIVVGWIVVYVVWPWFKGKAGL